jgi:hypothetical protein
VNGPAYLAPAVIGLQPQKLEPEPERRWSADKMENTNINYLIALPVIAHDAFRNLMRSLLLKQSAAARQTINARINIHQFFFVMRALPFTLLIYLKRPFIK